MGKFEDRIIFHDDIEDLSCENFVEHNAWIHQEIHGATTTGAVHKKLGSIGLMVVDDAKSSAVKELNNLQASYALAFNKIDPLVMSSACLVKSIDGELMHGVSSAVINGIVKQIYATGISVGDLKVKLSEVKKKSMTK